MTAYIATQTTNQASTNGFSWFVKSSLAAVALMATLGATEASAATTTIKCGASKGITNTCNANVNKVKGVTLRKQTGRRTCVAGQNWGQSGNGVWTKNGCKGKFDVYYGKLSKAERKKLRGIAGNSTPRPAPQAHSNNHDDLGKGLAIVGGLIVGAAILNEIFDNDHQAPAVQHQPAPQPTYNTGGYGYGNNNGYGQSYSQGWGNGNQVGHKRRKRLINKCSSAAVNDALAHGYSSAWMSNVKKVVRKGNGRFKVTGTLTQQFQQRAPHQNTGYRGSRQWGNGNFSWGVQHQPRYVTYEEKRTVTCIIKRGEVRKLRKW